MRNGAGVQTFLTAGFAAETCKGDGFLISFSKALLRQGERYTMWKEEMHMADTTKVAS